ncbi:hypothetical protein SJI00_07230 [Pseudomonas sp. RP23018S]|uniref:hypothetical protein n=1 Tax=Pseudomonas sp. RP23018S TaxID=3096037 RepID=UPI002ACA7629|nr:hypothetical protein [Pseudomonas sp. RP23018S]MDZ5602562.1 hypothetical protein [Pseudomonas sp. RP23018S]
MSEKTELAAVPLKETALQIYQAPNGLEPYLQKIRDEIDAFVPDVTTRKGRDAIASIAYKVARSKTALDNVGKELVAELKEIPKKIDAERKRMRDKLDAWQEEVRRPLNEWQAAEDARIDRHNDRLNWLKTLADDLGELSSLHIKGLIAEAEGMQLGAHWEEFEAEAANNKDRVLTTLRATLQKREQFEAEQAELSRLRREAEERAEADRIRQAQEQAVEAERQRIALQQQAERDAAARREQELLDQAAAQKRASEQAARDAEAAAERQRFELQQQAEQSKRAAEQAEANRIAAEKRAEQERQDAERRSEEAAERARQDERRRADAAAAEILRQQEARERDEAHRRSINRAALEAFVAGGMTEECARQAITLIAQRKIPNITISY